MFSSHSLTPSSPPSRLAIATFQLQVDRVCIIPSPLPEVKENERKDEWLIIIQGELWLEVLPQGTPFP